MAELMKDHGRIITCMDKEYTLGVMGEDMMESTSWTKNMAMEFTTGLMVGDTKVCGQMESNTERENIYCQIALQRLESGTMERG